ncbi:MAG: A/G-specific adenine glycosylase [Bacteroidetes bacterium]|nr:A/G-specific adenine glycosylase [Bacteroidota bacterium]
MQFTKALLCWYNENKRDLPWRRVSDPYLVWVSEIILQQTRIGQGMDYYLRFIERFPDIKTLAIAEEQEVLKVWQGLGYYSRARNMHTAVKQIITTFNGRFPEQYEQILSLKGVGEYTAAAIASLSFNLSFPVVDGNVMRFFSRFFGIVEPVDTTKGKNEIRLRTLEMIDKKQPGTFNQAIMEFGALVCKPANPDCVHCIFNKSCYAFKHGVVSELPVKSKVPSQKLRYFNYLVILTRQETGGRSVYLKKRIEKDIWHNLYDFPMIETAKAVSLKKLRQTEEWKKIFGDHNVFVKNTSRDYRHVLSHQVIIARFYQINFNEELNSPLLLTSLKKIADFPVPRLIENYLADED